MFGADEVEKKIENLLKQGYSRKNIVRQLKDKTDSSKLLFHINNIPEPSDKARFLLVNMLLLGLLAFITARKVALAFSFGGFDIYSLLSLVVPVINIYIFMEISKFRRIGYQFLSILSVLSLINPENQHVPEVVVLPVMAALSAFLYFKMFPRKRFLREIP